MSTTIYLIFEAGGKWDDAWERVKHARTSPLKAEQDVKDIEAEIARRNSLQDKWYEVRAEWQRQHPTPSGVAATSTERKAYEDMQNAFALKFLVDNNLALPTEQHPVNRCLYIRSVASYAYVEEVELD